MSRTFLKLHYDWLEREDYRQFMTHPANVTFTLILAQVYRGSRTHPSSHELANFYAEGWLVARPSLQLLHLRYPERSRRAIAKDIEFLEEMGLLDTYPWTSGGGTAQLIQVGSWTIITHAGSQREQYVETLYVDRIFGPNDEAGPFFG